MANEKTLNTRIKLRYDSLEAWASSNPTLLDGELAIAYLPPKGEGEAPAACADAVLFKVGPGAFNSLPWASALAADVYAWAKKPTLDVKDLPTLPIEVVDNGTGKFITDIIYADNKLTITRSDVAWNDIQDKPNLGVMSVDKKDGTAIEVDKTDAANPKVGFKIAATQGDHVTVTQSNDGLKVEVDTGVHAVSLASGTNQGTLKLTVDGTATDNIAVTGLGNLAFENSLDKEDVGLGNVDNTADMDKPVSTAQAAAIKVAKDRADEAYALAGTKADAATTYNKTEVNNLIAPLATTEALNGVRDTANAANTKIDTFLGTITPDGSANIIDTLAEINKYVGDHGEEFAELSGKVGDLEKKPGLDKVGTVTSITAGDGLDGGTITESGTIALNKATKDSLALADSALQKADIAIGSANGTISVEGTDVAVKGLGSAAYTNSTAYATAEQGGKADTAVQPGDLGTMAKENKDDYYTKNAADAEFMNADEVNTAIGNELAKHAGIDKVGTVTSVNVGAGFKNSGTATDPVIDVIQKGEAGAITWIFDCGGAE